MKKNNDGRIYSIHKSNILLPLCDLLERKLHQTMAVGDGVQDIDMIKNAGIGVAYHAPSEVYKHALLMSNGLRDLTRYM